MRQIAAIMALAISVFAGMTADSQMSLAEELRLLGRPERAAVEFLRFAHYYSDDDRAGLALFRAALCLEDAGELPAARSLFREIMKKESADSLRDAAFFRLPLTYYMDSGESCRRLSREFADSCSKKCQLSLVYLEGWSYLFERNYVAAESSFRRLDGALFDSSAAFMKAVSARGTALPHRSPILAASMSAVVPGLGRGYLGRWGDAIVSFIAVGGSAAGGYALWEKDRGFAISLLIAGAVFYGGNVYGSYVGGRYYNEEQNRELYRYAKEHVPRRPEQLYRF